MSKNKHKTSPSPKVKLDEIDPNYIFFVNTPDRINIAVSYIRRGKSKFMERYVYVHRCNVSIMLGLIESVDKKNAKVKVRWDPLIRALPYTSRDYERYAHKGIGFTWTDTKYSSNIDMEGKVPEYIDINVILYLSALMYGSTTGLFRYDLLVKTMMEALKINKITIDISQIPLVQNLLYILNSSNEIEYRFDPLPSSLRKLFPLPKKVN